MLSDLIHLFWHDPFITTACIAVAWIVGIGAVYIVVAPFRYGYRMITGRRFSDDLFEWERRWLLK